jgi:hypothetical protein
MRLSPLYRSVPDWLTATSLAAVLLLGGYAWASGFSARSLHLAGQGLMAVLALVGLALLVHGMRLRALGRDVATSKIASAPQGYVELFGKAFALPGEPIWSDQGWLWRRIVHARQSDVLFFRSLPLRMYKAVSWELTDRPFLLRDGSGEAVVLPDGAEVVCADRHTYSLRDARVMEETIRTGDDLYVLGHFSSYGSPPDLAAQAERLASDWTSDPEQRQRFDANRDGYLGVEELLALRAKARASVIAAARESPTSGVVHTVSRPVDASRFVISTVSPSALSRHNAVYLLLGASLLTCGVVGLLLTAAF